MRWGIPVVKLGALATPIRYVSLFETIRQHKCKILMEIGVWRGEHAKEMILTALETPGRATYYGFDLFDLSTPAIRKQEGTIQPMSEIRIKQKLTGVGVDVFLFKGFTRDTLPQFLELGVKPDFIFIDGGHKFEVVESDWNYVQRLMHDKTVVMFDDYFSCKDEIDWGCHRVVDSIKGYKVEPLEPHDTFMMKRLDSEKRVHTENRIVKVTK